jgi:hypothetical protein
LFAQVVPVYFLGTTAYPRRKLIQALILPEPFSFGVFEKHSLGALKFNCKVDSVSQGSSEEVLEQRAVKR